MTSWMEKHFLPVAVKIGSEKHLIAIRDAFVAIMPITMAGAIATLLNVLLRDFPTEWGMTEFVSSMSHIISINGNVWWGSLAMISLLFVFCLGYNLARAYNVNPIPGAIIAFSSLMAQMPQVSGPANVMSADGEILAEGFQAWGNINFSFTSATGLFTALLVGFISTMIYILFTKLNWTIKMPDSVPPAVAVAFSAIIPGTIAVYTISAIGHFSTVFTGMSLSALISTYIQTPFLALSQGLPAVLIMTFTVQLLWFFGFL